MLTAYMYMEIYNFNFCSGNIEIRSAEMSFGHCERYGWFKGFMDDVSKTNVILKNRVSVTILSIYIYISCMKYQEKYI